MYNGTYKIKNEDGRLALVSDDYLEWLSDIEIVTFPTESEIVVRVSLCECKDSNLLTWDVDDAHEIRAEMVKWLKDGGYSVSIPCDFRNKSSLAKATAQAAALYGRFLDGNHLPLTARYKVTWASRNPQDHMLMSEHMTEQEAVNSLPDIKADLLGQCSGGDDGARQRADVLASRLMVEAVWETDTDIFVGDFQIFDVADIALPEAA